MSSAPTASRKQAFANYVAELMEGFAPVLIKPMFGGFGVYRDGLMFALIADERLFLKVDEQSQPRFVARGLAPFKYEAGGKVASLKYHEAPPEAYDEPAHMAVWAQLGYECALRQQAKKAAKSRKPSCQPSGGAGRVAGAHQAEHTASALHSLGPKSQEMLALAGIQTEAQLREMGSVRAYARTKAVCPKASLNLLWVLEGVLTGRDGKAVAASDRASLLMALEDVLKQRIA